MAWKLYLNNRIYGLTPTVTDGAENASYPLVNVSDEDVQTVGKPNTTATTVWRYDLTAAAAVVGFGIARHTLGIQTASITVKYSSTDTSTDLWAELTTYTALTSGAIGNKDAVISVDSVSKRYWWVGITGQDAVVQIGEIGLFGLVRTLTRSPRLGLVRGKRKNISRSYTKGGYMRATKWGPQKKVWDVQFTQLTRTTDYAYIFTELDETYTEGYRPFWFTDEYYSADNYNPAYMVYVEGDELESSLAECDRYNLGFRLVEC